MLFIQFHSVYGIQCQLQLLLVVPAQSLFIKTVPRDFLNSLVAGGVASCTAGLYFTNPVWAMVLGSTAGGVQSLIQGLIEKEYL